MRFTVVADAWLASWILVHILGNTQYSPSLVKRACQLVDQSILGLLSTVLSWGTRAGRVLPLVTGLILARASNGGQLNENQRKPEQAVQSLRISDEIRVVVQTRGARDQNRKQITAEHILSARKFRYFASCCTRVARVDNLGRRGGQIPHSDCCF